MENLELAQACANQMVEKDRASSALGMAIEVTQPGTAEVQMTVTDNMVNGFDICHGGYLFTLADSAFAFACNAYNDVTVAASGSIDYLQPVKQGDQLTAIARETHRGKRYGVYDVEVRNQHHVLVAVFRGRSAALGRPLLPD